MANHLDRDKKLTAIQLFAEGLGVKSVQRIIHAHTDTLIRLRRRAAETCAKITDAKFVDLRLPFLEVDELWTFIQKRRAYCPEGNKGGVWIYVAIDPISKLAPHHLIGKRNTASAQVFMQRLQGMLAVDTQISTDKLSAYVRAIEQTNKAGYWGDDAVNYLAHARTVGAAGNGRAQTNMVETHNGQMRNLCCPLRRSGKGFAKTRDGLQDALWIYFFYYNFIRLHMTLGKRTPAMAAGIEAKPWTWAQLLRVAKEPGFARQKKVIRGPYGSRRSVALAA